MWIWMIRAIAGSILGNATAEWFKKTKLGVCFYNKVDSIYKWAAHKYDVKILTEEEKKMEKFQMLKKRLNNIEQQLKELKK